MQAQAQPTLRRQPGWVEDPNILGTKTICWQYQYDVNRHTNYKQVRRRDLKCDSNTVLTYVLFTFVIMEALSKSLLISQD